LRILIVDDDIYSGLALTNLLQHDHVLRIATNGQDALSLFAEGDYDAVVTDIRMPKMNGIELLKAIRCVNCEIPVIIISGHGTSDYQAEADEFGARAFFSKPLDVEQFMKVLYDLETNSV